MLAHSLTRFLWREEHQLMLPSSEAYEAEDRCFRVAVARRLMLPNLVASNAAAYVAQTCPNKRAGPNLFQTSGPTTAPLLLLSVRWTGLERWCWRNYVGGSLPH